MMTATMEHTYSSAEVCGMVGISYRQLDYWLRCGKLHIDNDAEGSGSRRRWTGPDIEALRLCVAKLHEADSIVASFQDGTMWSQARRQVRADR